MSQTSIPYIFMRGGSSRGPYFHLEDLPQDRDKLSEVLIAVIGSGHGLNIDGLGGGDAVTTKVAILSSSKDEWAEVDYFFAQVSVGSKCVDYKPTCGNILAGVGPAAIEMGIVSPRGETTKVKIRAVNTGARVVAEVHTDSDGVVYEGDTAIAGVPDTASPIELLFLEVVGAVTGSLFPTGNVQDRLHGIAITCMDVAMPTVIARASDFGLTGYESPEVLDDNKEFFMRLEAIRQEAGKLMGMGNVSQSVVPKFAVIAPARHGGMMTARYFVPWKTHPSMAVTGAQCIASCGVIPGTVADGLCDGSCESPCFFVLEHPKGHMDVGLDFTLDGEGFDLHSAGITRTARKLADGQVYIPFSVWDGLRR